MQPRSDSKCSVSQVIRHRKSCPLIARKLGMPRRIWPLGSSEFLCWDDNPLVQWDLQRPWCWYFSKKWLLDCYSYSALFFFCCKMLTHSQFRKYQRVWGKEFPYNPLPRDNHLISGVYPSKKFLPFIFFSTVNCFKTLFCNLLFKHFPILLKLS